MDDTEFSVSVFLNFPRRHRIFIVYYMGVGTAGTLWVQTAEVGRNVQQQGTFSKLGRYYVLTRAPLRGQILPPPPLSNIRDNLRTT